MGKPTQKESNSHQNPTVAKTEKSPPSERSFKTAEPRTGEGAVKEPNKKPSVKEKLERYQSKAQKQKEPERKEPEVSKGKAKMPEPNRQTIHTQPKTKKKSKER